MINKIESYYGFINSELEFISILQSRTWESEDYTVKRNAREKKHRLDCIEQSKKSIKYWQEEIKLINEKQTK